MAIDASSGSSLLSGAASGGTMGAAAGGPWGAFFGALGGAAVSGISAYANNTGGIATSGSQSGNKTISQDALDSIIYNIMSSDQGLAALSSGENTSGGFSSSTKGLMAQDLTAKLAGEIANITATTNQSSESSSKKKSVICTYLAQEGYLNKDLYEAGKDHFNNLPLRTVLGYLSWGSKVVKLMEKSPALCTLLTPVAYSRYNMIVHKKFGILGAITIYLGEPLCYLIGTLMGVKHGGFVN